MSAIAAGPYQLRYNADAAPGPAAGKGLAWRSLGIVERVTQWRRMLLAEPLQHSSLGKSTLDAIYQGSECRLSFTLKEWTPAVRDLLWPFGATWDDVGPIGRTLAEFAGRLELTAATGSTAHEHGPRRIVFGQAIIAPGEAIEIPLSAEPREIRVTMLCLPYLASDNRWVWSQTFVE